MRSTLSSHGQTAVPAEIRRRFNLKERSRLEWMVEGEAITVLPVPGDPVRAFRGSLKGRYTGAAFLADRRRSDAASGDVTDASRYTLDTSAVVAYFDEPGAADPEFRPLANDIALVELPPEARKPLRKPR